MSSLIVDQGVTWVRVWKYENPDGTPVVLTGCYAKFAIRLGNVDGPLALELDSDLLGGVVIDGPLGTVTVTIPAATSDDFVLDGVPQGSVSEIIEPAVYEGCKLVTKQVNRVATGYLCEYALDVTLSDATTVVQFEQDAMAIVRGVIR